MRNSKNLPVNLYTLTLRGVLFLAMMLGLQLAAIEPEAEAKLALLYAQIVEKETDVERVVASTAFKKSLKEQLYKKGALDYPFDSLRMCKILSPDRQFRLFNWNVPLKSGLEFYEAILMIPDAETDMVRLIELNDTSAEMDKVEGRICKPSEWYGALYYEVVPFKKGKSQQYLLLGWDGDTRITNKKVIDVLSFNGQSIRFGSPVFKTPEGLKKRVVFTYGEQSHMSLVYQPKDKRLVFDHLAPRNQSLEGRLQFYGPDMSFDALALSKGKWNWASNVEFTRKRDKKDKDFNDPRKN
jgi:hypothetical protein